MEVESAPKVQSKASPWPVWANCQESFTVSARGGDRWTTGYIDSDRLAGREIGDREGAARRYSVGLRARATPS